RDVTQEPLGVAVVVVAVALLVAVRPRRGGEVDALAAEAVHGRVIGGGHLDAAVRSRVGTLGRRRGRTLAGAGSVAPGERHAGPLLGVVRARFGLVGPLPEGSEALLELLSLRGE